MAKPVVMKIVLIPTALFAVCSSPVFAEVKTVTDAGFNIVHIAEVAADPDVIWKRLIAPKEYWSKAHSWSGSSEGFYIDPQANGCFCELFQEKGADGKTKTTGSVEHMRVIFAQPGKVLRMQGALGPLQSEAVLGTLTIAIEPLKGGMGSKLSFSYVVGGYMRYKTSEIAPAVDKVLGEQFKSLISPYVTKIGGEGKGDGFSLDVEKLGTERADVEAESAAEAPAIIGTTEADATEPKR